MRRFVVLLFVLGAVAQTVVFRPPVDAPVLDPFRPPEDGYGPGNRGLEYDTPAGVRVDAAGPGVVVFAGPVAGRSWVTVDHGDGLRTSYGPVAAIAVSAGDVVSRGTRLAVTTGPLHFSARVDGVYVDPAELIGRREIRVRLVDHWNNDDAHWLALVGLEERRHLALREGGGFWGLVDRVVGAALMYAIPGFGPHLSVTDQVAALVHAGELALTLGENLDREALVRRLVSGLVRILDPAECTPVAAAVALPALPARRRIALVIDGLDSASDADGAMSRLDLEGLGYDRSDIGRVSYRGGLVPGTGDDAWPVERTGYSASSTRGDVEPQIDQVAATLRAIAAANPGVPIDVYGHSLGGLIARHAIAATDGEVPVAVAITLAAPHGGAPLADFVEAAEATTPGSLIAEVVDAAGADDMALLAPVVEDLSMTGFAGDTADVAFPDSVHAVTIGSRSDVVVPASLAGAPGAHHVIVGGLQPVGAHGEIAGLPEVEREVRLALAGLPPACSGTTDAILDLVVPEAIAFGENAISAGLLAADVLPS